jgi:SAM-dependent methyltransferase
MWDAMQQRGYFEKYPAYQTWRDRMKMPLPDLAGGVPGEKSLPDLLAGLDFSAREILFDPQGADPYKFFDDELDPALKSTEELWLPMMVDLDARMTVLDIGCGFGRTEEWLMKRVKEVCGVDISDYIIGVCNKRFSGIGNVHFYTNSGYDLSLFEESKFDFSYCFNVFQHIPRKFTEEYLAEIRRTLKPGGVFLFNVLSGINYETEDGPYGTDWSIGYEEEEIDRLLKKSGLTPAATFTWRLAGAPQFWIWKRARK